VKPDNSQTIVAAFDFDGTLTYHDTLLPFLFSLNAPLTTVLAVFLAIPALALAVLNGHYRQVAKETILRRTISKVPAEMLRKQAENFASGPLQTKIRPEAWKKLQWHKQQGHRCLLISANLDVYLEPWALSAGFHDLICSKLEIDGKGYYTGNLVGLNCRGPEKAQRLLQVLGPKNNYILYAYGDSRGDKELLQMADHPFYRCFN
jgi:phosphatidylglycerophosphatase C